MQPNSKIASICILSAMLLFAAYVLFVRPSVHLVSLPVMRNEFDALKAPEGSVSSGDIRTVYKSTLFAVAQTYRTPNATATDVLRFYRNQFDAQGWRFAGLWGGNPQNLLFCKDALVANVDASPANHESSWIQYTVEIWSGDVPVKPCPEKGA